MRNLWITATTSEQPWGPRNDLQTTSGQIAGALGTVRNRPAFRGKIAPVYCLSLVFKICLRLVA